MLLPFGARLVCATISFLVDLRLAAANASALSSLEARFEFVAFGTQRLKIAPIVGTAFGERCDMIDLVASVQWEPAASAFPSPRRSYQFLEIWRNLPFHALRSKA